MLPSPPITAEIRLGGVLSGGAASTELVTIPAKNRDDSALNITVFTWCPETTCPETTSSR
jgi:hypothetical protein